MPELKDEFKRPGFKEIGLPKRACECAPIVLQKDGEHILLLVDGKSHRLTDTQARHLKKDLKHLLGEG